MFVWKNDVLPRDVTSGISISEFRPEYLNASSPMVSTLDIAGIVFRLLQLSNALVPILDASPKVEIDVSFLHSLNILSGMDDMFPVSVTVCSAALHDSRLVYASVMSDSIVTFSNLSFAKD